MDSTKYHNPLWNEFEDGITQELNVRFAFSSAANRTWKDESGWFLSSRRYGSLACSSFVRVIAKNKHHFEMFPTPNAVRWRCTWRPMDSNSGMCWVLKLVPVDWTYNPGQTRSNFQWTEPWTEPRFIPEPAKANVPGIHDEEAWHRCDFSLLPYSFRLVSGSVVHDIYVWNL